jgi:lysophospholipase L1-like esterase
MAESQQDHIRRRLFSPPTPQTGELTEYRKFWLGRILQLYRNSPTRIVFLELPRGPLINPSRPASTAFVDWARKQPNVVVLHPETFRSLETPETFFDGLHLNRSGRTIFSARLAEKLLDAVPKS